jgi:hypothetical protein
MPCRSRTVPLKTEVGVFLRNPLDRGHAVSQHTEPERALGITWRGSERAGDGSLACDQMAGDVFQLRLLRQVDEEQF